MGQNHCNMCNNTLKEEVSMIQHQNTSKLTKTISNNLSGDFFLKSYKTDDKSNSIAKKDKPVYTKRQAAIILQSFFRAALFRKQFLKVKVRKKIEEIKLVETIKDNFIPDKVRKVLEELNPFKAEKYKKLNTGNKFILCLEKKIKEEFRNTQINNSNSSILNNSNSNSNTSNEISKLSKNSQSNSNNNFNLSNNSNLDKSERLNKLILGPCLIIYNKDCKDKNSKDDKDIKVTKDINKNQGSPRNEHENKNLLLNNPLNYNSNNNNNSSYKLNINNKLSNKSNKEISLQKNNTKINNSQNIYLMNAKTDTHFSEKLNYVLDTPSPLLTSENKNKSFYYGMINIKNQRHGSGIYISEEGKYYEGNWNKNKFEGYGRMIDSKGMVTEEHIMGVGEKFSSFTNYKYSGEFSSSKKEGLGKEETEDYIYEGLFLADSMHGIGKMYYKKFGDKYEGEFKRGLIEGNGTYTWKNKESFSGTFKKGKMHGEGVYSWSTGREFFGTYVDNIKEGPGEFRWKNGQVLQCSFVKGKPHGMGVIKDKESNTQRVVTVEEIKQILKSEKKLTKEFSYLEYVNSEVDKTQDFNVDLCSEHKSIDNNSDSNNNSRICFDVNDNNKNDRKIANNTNNLLGFNINNNKYNNNCISNTYNNNTKKEISRIANINKINNIQQNNSSYINNSNNSNSNTSNNNLFNFSNNLINSNLSKLTNSNSTSKRKGINK